MARSNKTPGTALAKTNTHAVGGLEGEILEPTGLGRYPFHEAVSSLVSAFKKKGITTKGQLIIAIMNGGATIIDGEAVEIRGELPAPQGTPKQTRRRRLSGPAQ